jgi:hypothetical protein
MTLKTLRVICLKLLISWPIVRRSGTYRAVVASWALLLILLLVRLLEACLIEDPGLGYLVFENRAGVHVVQEPAEKALFSNIRYPKRKVFNKTSFKKPYEKKDQKI